MNSEIAKLIASLGIEAASALLVQNVGPIPPTPGHWNRGFKLVLLSSNGTPTHFCRCQPASATGLAEEAEIITALRSDEELAAVLPTVISGCNSRVRVFITNFVSRGDCIHRVSRASVHAWGMMARDVMRLSLRMGVRAPSLLLGFNDRRPIAPLDPVAEQLRALDAVIERPLLDPLRACLAESPPVPRSVQHGDLWAGNLLDLGEGWQMLDFELFGQIQVPLYDVCQFIRTSLDLRVRRGDMTWLDIMRAGAGEAQIARDLLRSAAESHALDASQRVAACVYYVVDFAGRLAMRGARPVHFRFFREVESFGRALVAGEDLDGMLFGHATVSSLPAPSPVHAA